jgi:hypothetical protein
MSQGNVEYDNANRNEKLQNVISPSTHNYCLRLRKKYRRTLAYSLKKCKYLLVAREASQNKEKCEERVESDNLPISIGKFTYPNTHPNYVRILFH